MIRQRNGSITSQQYKNWNVDTVCHAILNTIKQHNSTIVDTTVVEKEESEQIEWFNRSCNIRCTLCTARLSSTRANQPSPIIPSAYYSLLFSLCLFASSVVTQKSCFIDKDYTYLYSAASEKSLWLPIWNCVWWKHPTSSHNSCASENDLLD